MVPGQFEKALDLAGRNRNLLFRLGIGSAAVYGSYLGLSALLSRSDSGSFVPASLLGKRGVGLERELFEETEELTASQRVSISTGTYFHSLVQQGLEVEGAESEVEVVDKNLGIKGFIDVLLKGNIPVEIKTISSTGLDRLSRPLEPHASQLNFYLHARKAKFGYLMYLDGENPNRTKVFKVGFQPGRLVADIEEVKSRIMLNPDSVNNKYLNWMTNQYQTSPAYFRGIRHSTGSASSWESMNPSQDFPGGRIASSVQAARFKPIDRRFYPGATMGLTTRLHETAIGHRSRSSAAKRLGSRHCNGSRAYR